MTRKIIELKQAPVVLVELPEGSTRHRIQSIIGVYRMDYLVYDLPNNNNTFIGLPIGVDHEIVGLLSDLTEEQFAECVERIDQEYTFGYRDYTGFIDDLSKARHSFSSLLESEKVYTENPLEKVAKSIGHGTLDNFDQDYAEAQSRTIDPTRTVVLLRKED